MSTNETFPYESYLRIIPLQNETFLVTWQPYRSYEDAEGYKYVIRVLGKYLSGSEYVNE